MEEIISMTNKEVDRLKILEKVLDKTLKQKEAADLLKVDVRHIRRLLKRYKAQGPKGLISKKRGKPSNHKKSNDFKRSVLALVKEKYEGFGPTLAKEKLEEWHGLKLSVETLRSWMIETHLWYHKIRKKQAHPLRERRVCLGELIQADGSHHHWFGEEFPEVNLTVLIDDATSKITSLYFSQSETLDSYFEALEEHLMKYGRPRALYTDRFSVFEANNKQGITQMQRALKELDIDLILASSPQAKGRVERSNRTLQDRLIKELRLRGITTLQEANIFAKEYIEIYNQKFSKEPMNNLDAHRLLEGYDLSLILCRLETRTLLSDCMFQFNNQFFKIQDVSDIRRLKGRKVTLRLTKKGVMRVFLENKELKYCLLYEQEAKPQVLNSKELAWYTPQRKPPADSHPWKRFDYQVAMRNKSKKTVMV